MRRAVRRAALGALAAPAFAAFAHHPGEHPAGSIPWWQLVIAGGIALVALWIVGRIRRRAAGRRAAAADARKPGNLPTDTIDCPRR